jgi:hypothetical protein
MCGERCLAMSPVIFHVYSTFTDLLDGLRGEAVKYGCNIRTVEKALFKKNLDESKG